MQVKLKIAMKDTQASIDENTDITKGIAKTKRNTRSSTCLTWESSPGDGCHLFLRRYMGHHDCKQKVAEALKADAIHEASQAPQQWVKIDNKIQNRSGVFYLSCAAIHLKNGSP